MQVNSSVLNYETKGMATKIKRLLCKGTKDTSDLMSQEDVRGNSREMKESGRKRSFSLSSLLQSEDTIIQRGRKIERYEELTRQLSKEMRSFLPSPGLMKRRNAICEEILQRRPTVTKGCTDIGTATPES